MDYYFKVRIPLAVNTKMENTRRKIQEPYALDFELKEIIEWKLRGLKSSISVEYIRKETMSEPIQSTEE